MSDRHRFRFFVASTGHEAGSTVALDAADAAHADVIRLAVGDDVEIVDGAGDVWRARIDLAPGVVECVERLETVPERDIHLYAGAATGGTFDDLVDAAVQAGATRIIPVAWNRRERDRLTQRAERMARIALAAAKQSKRACIPPVEAPIDFETLIVNDALGIVLDASGSASLDVVVAALAADRDDPIRLLVGPADGIDAADLDRLRAAGWTSAHLGPSILRAELAAPVAVAIAAICSPALRSGR